MNLRPAFGPRSFSLLALLALPGLSLASGYLSASGGVITLVGGTSDYYNNVISPATDINTVTGSAHTTLTAAGYSTGYADLFGDASAQSAATFGQLTESSSASARGYTGYSTCGYGGTAGYASEVVTIHGSGPISLTLHARLVGDTLVSSTNNVVDGANSRLRSQVSIGPSGYVNQSQNTEEDYDYSTGNVFDSLLTSTITVFDGNELRISGSMEESGGAQLLDFNFDPQGLRTVTAGNQGNLQYWISLSPGATLSSESGYLYRAPAAVPEPTTLAALGLGAFALIRRRRFK